MARRRRVRAPGGTARALRPAGERPAAHPRRDPRLSRPRPRLDRAGAARPRYRLLPGHRYPGPHLRSLRTAPPAGRHAGRLRALRRGAAPLLCGDRSSARRLSRPRGAPGSRAVRRLRSWLSMARRAPRRRHRQRRRRHCRPLAPPGRDLPALGAARRGQPGDAGGFAPARPGRRGAGLRDDAPAARPAAWRRSRARARRCQGLRRRRACLGDGAAGLGPGRGRSNGC